MVKVIHSALSVLGMLGMLGMLGGAQAATYTVPANTYQLKVTLKGAGGGAGGADKADNPATQSAAGGMGIAGSLLVVQFPVNPGDTVTYEEGAGGLSGQSYNGTTGSLGGAGGAGQGAGAAGGDAPLANAGNNSGSGGGGGGGGATYVTVNGMYARAGGGGGGGGGSWNLSAYSVSPAVAGAVEEACDTGAAGTPGEAGTGNRQPNSLGRGGGGGGGSGGGFAAQPAVTPAKSGWDDARDPIDGAHAGETGGSCYSTGVTLVNFDPDGGSAGSGNPPSSSDASDPKPPADPGLPGEVIFDPIVTPPAGGGAATPVPGLSGAGLVLLSGLVAALGLRRKRKR